MRSGLYRCVAAALSVMSFSLLATLLVPTNSVASAPPVGGRASPSVGAASYEIGKFLSVAQVKQLLAKLPLAPGSSPLTPQELATALSHLSTLESSKIPHLEEALKTSLEGVGSTTTLEEALANPTLLVSPVIAAVEKILPLGLLELEGLLGGKSGTQSLQEALEKANSGELLNHLLGNGAGGPTKTLEALLAKLPASTIKELLSSGLGSSSVTEETVGELAASLGKTPQQLAEAAEAVGETSAELPATAKALTTPLANGEVLGVLEGANKAVVTTLAKLAGGISGEGTGKGSEGGTGGSGGSGSSGGSGGSGGAGGPGGSGSNGSSGGSGTGKDSAGSGGSSGNGGGAGGSTVNVSLTSPTAISQQKGASRKASKSTSLKVISYRVHGNKATVMVSVPAAGTLVVKGAKLRSARLNVAGPKRMSIIVRLKGAAKAAARKHKKGIVMVLQLRFTPKHGKASTTSVRLRFH